MALNPSSGGWSPDLANRDVQAVIAASIAINLLVLAVPFYINRVYVAVLPQKAGDTLLVFTGVLLVVVLLDLILKIVRSRVLTLMGAADQHNQQLAGVRALLAAPLEQSMASTLEERVTQLRSGSVLRNRFLQQWLFRYLDVPFVGLYLVVMALIGGWLFLVPLLLLPAFVAPARRAVRESAQALRGRQDKENDRNAVLFSCLTGASTVKGLAIEGFLVRRLEPIQEQLSLVTRQQQVAASRLQQIGQVYAQWSALLVVSIGAWMAMHHNLSTGALAACTLLSRQITLPFSRFFGMASLHEQMALAEANLQAVQSLPAEPHLLSGEPVPSTGDLALAGQLLPQGSLLVLDGGEPGQSSRLLAAVTGFASTDTGPIRYAGQPTASFSLSELRRRLPLITPMDTLYRGTVLDNLTLFRPSILGAQAVTLCDALGLSAEIQALPRGFDTTVGEQADFPLSRGLQFRLQVAAALMEQPAALLIDHTGRRPAPELLDWLLQLPCAASRLIAVAEPVPLPAVAGLLRWRWQGDRLTEVSA